MAKVIRMSTADIESAVEEFRSAITNNPMISDGKLSYTKTFPKNGRKATIHFSEIAYLKMTRLVEKFSKEIAWHGVAFRGDDLDKDDYYITDILVYPQEVTGATVTTDQTKYQDWLYSHDDDIFNNIRFQGHSHVNMGVTPSGTDETLYDSIIGMMGADDFYIFGIWNKKNSRNISIYDMKKNLVFDNSEVSVDVIDGGIGIDKFLKEAEGMVVEHQYQYNNTNAYTNWNQYSYGDQNGYSTVKLTNSVQQSQDKPKNPVTPASAVKTGTTSKKKKQVDVKTAKIALCGLRDEYDCDDYDNDPYSAFGHT